MNQDGVYDFGPFRLDATERVLLRHERLVSLAPKAFSTLLTLVRNQGHVVEKDTLMEEVWPDEDVEEGNLSQHIFMLRKALSENNGSQEYIETVPRRGYRFVAPVRYLKGEDPSSSENDPETFAQRRGASAELAAANSIAVLPFRTFGDDTQSDYLGLGIADALITRLSNLKLLIVRPTSAVRSFLKDPVSAGNKLRVARVLEGTIQQSDDDLRVTVQLVNVRDGAILWAEKFDENFTSIFAIEDSISEQVAKILAVKLTAKEQTQLAMRYTDNVEAYHAYLKGHYFLEKRTAAGINKAVEYFDLAITIDASYALAYAGLAECYCLTVLLDLRSPQESARKAREAALLAVGIDPDLAEAHSALGRSKLLDWDWPAAEKEFRMAIELNPNYAIARHSYSIQLRDMRRFEESLAQSRKVEELEPISANRKATTAGTLYCAGRYEEAIETLFQALELEADNWTAHYYLGRIYVQLAKYREAISEYQKAKSLLRRSVELEALLAHAYAVSGQTKTAEKILAKLDERSNREYVPPCHKAWIHMGLDRKDLAFACLEKAYQEHDLNLVILATDPIFQGLHDEVRFKQLLQRIGLMAHLGESRKQTKAKAE